MPPFMTMHLITKVTFNLVFAGKIILLAAGILPLWVWMIYLFMVLTTA